MGGWGWVDVLRGGEGWDRVYVEWIGGYFGEMYAPGVYQGV